MNITWKAPLNTGNCDVLMYMLEYKVLEPGKDWEVNHIKDKRTFYILRERLTAGQKLVVSLSAVNCAGLGEKSTKYKITFAANGKTGLSLCGYIKWVGRGGRGEGFSEW